MRPIYKPRLYHTPFSWHANFIVLWWSCTRFLHQSGKIPSYCLALHWFCIQLIRQYTTVPSMPACSLCRPLCLAALFPSWWIVSVIRCWRVSRVDSWVRCDPMSTLAPHDDSISLYVCLSIILIRIRLVCFDLQVSGGGTNDHSSSRATSLLFVVGKTTFWCEY